MKRASLHSYHAVAYHAARKSWFRHRAMVLLSPVEQHLMTVLAQGIGTAEVALALHRSVKTIEAHIARLCQRLGINGRAELTIAAEQLYGRPDLIPVLDLSLLTERELEFAALVAQGMPYTEIAKHMGIRKNSVWLRVSAIKQKSGIETLPMLRAAARKAIEQAA